MEGWIKLYRKFCEWEWFNISEMVHLFIYLLLNANMEKGKWRGIDIKRGQILTGLHILNKKTGISIRTLRTCLDRLEKTKEIDRQTTNKYSIITICNYESYQLNRQAIDKQSTNNRQATDKQSTTNKNNKEGREKKEELLVQRESKFKSEVYEFMNEYPESMLNKFSDYWTEKNKAGIKMRFELEKTFEISKRLITWVNRDREFNKIPEPVKPQFDYGPES